MRNLRIIKAANGYIVYTSEVSHVHTGDFREPGTWVFETEESLGAFVTKYYKETKAEKK